MQDHLLACAASLVDRRPEEIESFHYNAVERVLTVRFKPRAEADIKIEFESETRRVGRSTAPRPNILTPGGNEVRPLHES